MMKRALAVLLMFAACQTPSTTDAGCSKENCRRMIYECKVDLPVHIDVTCFPYPSDAGIEELRDRITEYCAEACTGTHSEKVVECFANSVDQCDYEHHTFPNCQAKADSPETSCEQRCTAQKSQCETSCSGGAACTSCRTGGGDCTAVCPGTDVMSCLDCTEACLPAYFACADACPRAK